MHALFSAPIFDGQCAAAVVVETVGESGLSAAIQIRIRGWLFCAILVGLSTSFGCVKDTYQYGIDPSLDQSKPATPASINPISQGGELPRIDRIETFVQAPKKFLRKIARRPEPDPVVQDQRRIEAVALAQEYLAANGLSEVRIEVRDYQPREQWERLKANSSIRPIWKYTGGTLNWFRYTILPMRAFHTDHYDPYTNTLHINSTQPHEALFESALAKQFQSHSRLGIGTYVMMQFVPFVPLYHTAKASTDVLTFSERHLDGEVSAELYPLTYARLGSTAVSEILSVVSISPNAPIFTRPLLSVAGGTVGRSTGKTLARSKHRDGGKSN